MDFFFLIFTGILTFFFLVYPDIALKIFDKNSKDIKKSRKDIRYTLGIVSLIALILYAIDYFG